jgi:hypothetical protein
MSNSALIVELRKRAIETLSESTEMFKQARTQRKAGDLEEAEKTKEMARGKRTDSAWLMNEASRLERSPE